MTKAKIAGGAVATVLVLLALAAVDRILRADVEPAAPTPTANAPANAEAAAEAHHGFLCGRIATRDGVTYVGRLRFGGGEEAAWGDYFNGAKEENPWVAHLHLERRPRESYPIEIFGAWLPRSSTSTSTPARLRPTRKRWRRKRSPASACRARS